jgi:hypothetical protein
MAISSTGDNDSRSFGTQVPKRAALVKPTGGQAGELYDLRDDVDLGFRNAEGRVDFPQLEWVDGGAFAAAGGDVVLKGANLVQGQTFHTWTSTGATDNDKFAVTALKPGEDEGFEVVVTDTGSLTVDLSAGVLAITINGGTTTAGDVATAINADAANTNGILRGSTPGDGSGNASVESQSASSGGTGSGWACYVSGVECLPANENATEDATAKVTETAATVTVPDLTAETDARAIGDIVSVSIWSDGVYTMQLSVVLT